MCECLVFHKHPTYHRPWIVLYYISEIIILIIEIFYLCITLQWLLHTSMDASKMSCFVRRFGPLIWRSSKERKKLTKAARSVKCNSGDSGIQIEVRVQRHPPLCLFVSQSSFSFPCYLCIAAHSVRIINSTRCGSLLLEVHISVFLTKITLMINIK